MTAFLSSIFIGSFVALFLSLWHKKMLILSIASFGVWSCCVLPSFASVNAAGAFIATILSIEALVICILNNQNVQSNRFLIIWCMSIVWSSIDQTVSSELFNNTIAPIHIISAVLAKVFAWIGVFAKRNLLKAACAFQVVAILSGMIWAFNAPAWGQFWQWDAIETISLIELLVLFIASKSGSAFGLVSVLVLFCAADLLGSGYFNAASIHSYQSGDAIHLSFIIVYLISSIAWIKNRVSDCNHSSLCEKVALITSVMLTIILCAGIEIDSFILTIYFATAFIALACDCVRQTKKTCLNYVCGALALMTLPIIDQKPENYQISVFGQNTVLGSTSLAVIKTDKDNSEKVNQIGLLINNDLIYVKVNDIEKTYYYAFPHVWEMRVVGYEPATGGELRVKSVSASLIWFFVVLACLLVNLVTSDLFWRGKFSPKRLFASKYAATPSASPAALRRPLP